jgi:hypothetical protein
VTWSDRFRLLRCVPVYADGPEELQLHAERTNDIRRVGYGSPPGAS